MDDQATPTLTGAEVGAAIAEVCGDHEFLDTSKGGDPEFTAKNGLRIGVLPDLQSEAFEQAQGYRREIALQIAQIMGGVTVLDQDAERCVFASASFPIVEVVVRIG